MSITTWPGNTRLQMGVGAPYAETSWCDPDDMAESLGGGVGFWVLQEMADVLGRLISSDVEPEQVFLLAF
ncbi:MAG: hypothetical protein KGJ86_00980 [Chloroflexota bacterium]|nr:hypothetical protein [Chloroflexota bacterium]